MANFGHLFFALLCGQSWIFDAVCIAKQAKSGTLIWGILRFGRKLPSL
jgi:hypothetical protein